jgi:hypothetical protein
MIRRTKKNFPKKESSKVAIRVIGREDIREAEKVWKQLETQVTEIPLVCRWEWVSTWITHFGDIVDYWFCVGYVHDKPVGITIITKESKRYLPFPVNAYHLGTQGEPLKDWIHMVNNNVLAQEIYYQQYVENLAEALITHFSWEQFLVNDADPRFANAIKKALTRMKLPMRELVQTCNTVDLEALRKTGKTVMQNFSHDTRYQIRRNLKEFEGLEIDYAESLKQAETILNELITLHQDSFRKRGKRGAFTSERFTRFHKALLKKMFHTGAIILFRAKSKRLGTIGCFYLFNDNGIAFGYLAGLTDFSEIEITTINKKRLKPGFVMHALCMQECLDRGLQEYHFSVGNEPYKDELTSDYRSLVTLKVQKSYKAKFRETMFEAYIRAEEQRKFQLLLKPVYGVYLLLNK